MGGYGALALRQALARAGIDEDRIGLGAVILGPSLAGTSTVLAAVRSLARESGATTYALQGALRSQRLVFDTGAQLLAEPDRAMVITVDDADLLGAPAAAEIFRRVVYSGVRPFLACTTGAPRPDLVDALWKDGHLPRIDLPDLDTAQIGEAARELLPAPLLRSETEYLQRWSGGRAGVLTEVLTALAEQGARPAARSAESLRALLAAGPRTCEAARAIDARLDGAVREHLQLLAVCALAAEKYGQGWITLSVAKRICGWEVLIDAEQRGLIEASETAVRFTAPYLPAVLLDGVPVLQRRRWRDRAAEELARGGVDDRSTMTIAALGDDGSDAVPAAARSALRAARADTAARWAGRAGEEGAVIALWAGLHTSVTDLAAPLPSTDDPVWAPVLSVLVDHRRTWQDHGAHRMLALLGAGDTAIVAAAAGLPVAVQVRAQATAEDTELMGVADAWWGLLVGAAALEAGLGVVAARVFDQARPAARADLLLAIRLRAAAVHAAGIDGDLAVTARQAARLHADTEGLGPAAHWVAEALQARVHAQTTGIPERVSTADSCAAVAWESWRQACDGEVGAAVDRLCSAAARVMPAAAGRAAEWTELALRWSRPDPDADWPLRLTAQTLAVASGPRHQRLHAYAQAWTEADGSALDRVAQRYADVGRWGTAADVAAQAATVHRGRSQAAASATAARRCWMRAGTDPSPITGPWLTAMQDLTAREREVVDLLVGGGTSADVARTLGVSVRTVESHVFNACRKTGTTDRAALLRAVAGG